MLMRAAAFWKKAFWLTWKRWQSWAAKACCGVALGEISLASVKMKAHQRGSSVGDFLARGEQSGMEKGNGFVQGGKRGERKTKKMIRMSWLDGCPGGGRQPGTKYAVYTPGTCDPMQSTWKDWKKGGLGQAELCFVT